MSLAGIDRSEPGGLADVRQNVEPQKDAAEHAKMIEEYLQSLSDGRLVEKRREADAVVATDTYLPPQEAPEAAQPVRPEQPPVQEQKKPVAAPENSELIAKMRDLANGSTTAALTDYRSEVGSRILFQITAIVVLLVLALLLFEFSQPARFGVYVAGLVCWFAALVVCVNLPRSVRHLGSDACHSSGTTKLAD